MWWFEIFFRIINDTNRKTRNQNKGKKKFHLFTFCGVFLNLHTTSIQIDFFFVVVEVEIVLFTIKHASFFLSLSFPLTFIALSPISNPISFFVLDYLLAWSYILTHFINYQLSTISYQLSTSKYHLYTRQNISCVVPWLVFFLFFFPLCNCSVFDLPIPNFLVCLSLLIQSNKPNHSSGSCQVNSYNLHRLLVVMGIPIKMIIWVWTLWCLLKLLYIIKYQHLHSH